MKLLLLMVGIAFANENIKFAPATTKLDIGSATTVVHKDAEITALKGWSIGMNEQNNKTLAFEILMTPTKDLSFSDVHAGLILKGEHPKMTLEEKEKMYKNKKGYQVAYQTINGDKWLFYQHEIAHEKGFPYIEVTGVLVKGNREFQLLAGYPKSQESSYKSEIDKIVSSAKIKD